MFLLVHAALAASLTQSSQTDFSAGSHDNTTSSATAGDVLVERVVTDSGEWLDQGNDHVALQKDDNTWFDTAGCPSNFFSGSTATYNGTPFIGGPATVSGRVAGMRSGVAVDPPSGENYVDEVHYLHPGGRCSVQYHTLTWTYSDGTTSSSTYKNYHDCGSYNASGSDFAITHLGSYGSYGCCSHWYEAAFTNPSPSKLVDSVSMTYNDGCGGSYLGQMWAVTMVLDGDDYDAWSGGGTEGVFTSSVLDAGDPSAEWTAVSWSSTLGTGDSLTVAVRSGSTSSPDGSWSGWGSENTAAASLSSSGRYLQYRVSFTASTSAAALHDITLSYELDTDGDGSLTDVDCDDTDDTVAPGATELCDGQLNDCDSSIGADEADDDNDGWVECAIDGGGWDGSTISGGEDCDDGDSSVFPGATELCDGLLNDCEGSIGADEADDDNDGWVECAVDSGGWDGSTISGGEDCDDGNSSVNPGATEVCDGVDNECDGDTDEGLLGTGASCPATDCQAVLANNPSAASGSYTLGAGSSTYTASCQMSIDGGGWTQLTSSHLATLSSTSRNYLYTYGSAWYRSPTTSAVWSWSSYQVATGTYTYASSGNTAQGSFSCSNGEGGHRGVGCSNGPGGQWKTLPWGGSSNTTTGTTQICQDKPGIFGGACRGGVQIWVR